MVDLNSRIALLVLLLFVLTGACHAEEFPEPPASIALQTAPFQPAPGIQLVADGKPVLNFFFNQNCGECLRTLPFIEQTAADHPEIVVRYFDIKENDTNFALFQQYKHDYGKEFYPVPSVFLGDQSFAGYDEITLGVEDAIAAALTNASGHVIPTLPTTPSLPGGTYEELTIPLVIAAALVDGINPCAFAVLIFLLLTLAALDTRRRMAAVGAAFIIAVFIFYFLSGLGLFAIIQSAGISRLISLVAAIIAIAAGVLSIMDGIRGGADSALSIPDSKKGILERYVKQASVPAAFILGILVGMFELPCTGGIYLAILSLLSNSMTIAEGIPYLLLYNFFFIIPLIIILAIVTLGAPVERMDEWRTKNRMYIRLAMGVVMIGLGIILLLEVL